MRYLPQHYFEELTNEIEIEKFRYEIEEVVFSHVDETDKLGKATFAELQEAKTLEIKQQVSLLKQRLRELNVEIARLEEDGSPRFRQQLRGQIEARNEELKALESAKPKEFAKPDEETDDQKELAAKVDGLSELLSSLKDAEKSNLDHSLRLKSRLQIASSLRERLGAVAAMVKESEATLKDGLNSFGLTFTDIIQFASDLEPLESKIRKLNAEIQVVEKDSQVDPATEKNLLALSTIPDLRRGAIFIEQQIAGLKEQLSTPQRRYQAYVKRLAAWESKKADLLGSETSPKPNSLKWLLAQQTYLDQERFPQNWAMLRQNGVRSRAKFLRAKARCLSFIAI